MKRITLEKAIELASNPEGKAYMLVRLAPDSTIEELTFAEAFFTEGQEEKPAEKKKTGPKRKPLDHGKINALYKAGWSVPKIADEMQCSAQAVYNHLEEKE